MSAFVGAVGLAGTPKAFSLPHAQVSLILPLYARPPCPSHCCHPRGTWLWLQVLPQHLSNICLLFGNRNYSARQNTSWSLRSHCWQPAQPQPGIPGSKILLLLRVAFCSPAAIIHWGAGARLRGDLAGILPKPLLRSIPALPRASSHPGPAAQEDTDGAFPPFSH